MGMVARVSLTGDCIATWTVQWGWWPEFNWRLHSYLDSTVGMVARVELEIA